MIIFFNLFKFIKCFVYFSYEKLISSSQGGKIVNYAELLKFISDIIMKNEDLFNHPTLAPLKTTFT